MPTKIETITPEQEAMFPEWVEKWTKIGLSTDPMDFERAKKAVKKLYTITGNNQPKKILKASSPMEAVKKGVLAVKKLQNPDIDEKDIPKSDYSDATQNFYGGSLYASWGSFVTFFRDVMDWENESLEDFKWGEELMYSCGWVWWHEDVCVIVDRPEIIKMDEENRLHCEDGPAIKYRDNWTVYSWRGTRIPREWIQDKENLDPTIALTWENVEQRRCAAEIIGWHRVLDKLNAVVIDEDGDPEIGTLVEVDIPDIGRERFLRVLCGTKREFALPVPPEMKTAIEAQAWTWNMDLKEFAAPEVRT